MVGGREKGECGIGFDWGRWDRSFRGVGCGRLVCMKFTRLVECVEEGIEFGGKWF